MILVRLLLGFSVLGLLSCGNEQSSANLDRTGGQEPPDPCPRFYRYRDGWCEVREVYVPGGKFTMGRGVCPVARPMEDPVNGCELSDNPHEVEVKPFYIDIAPVSLQRFPCHLSGNRCFIEDEESIEHLEKKTRRADVTEVPSSTKDDQLDQLLSERCASWGKRLIREDEWEFAATAGGTRTYPWGEAPPSCDRLLLDPEVCQVTEDQVWHEWHLVGYYPASLEGIYDLVGFFPHVVAPNPAIYSDTYSPAPYIRHYPYVLDCKGNPDPACSHQPYPCNWENVFDGGPEEKGPCAYKSWGVRGGRAMTQYPVLTSIPKRSEDVLKGYVRSLSVARYNEAYVRCVREAP